MFSEVTADMLNELSRPIPRNQIKHLTKKWKDKNTGEHKQYTVQHITARTVMNRLDETVGRYNWRTHYKPVMVGKMPGVECTIEILIAGEWIGKTDVGTPTDIEAEKGAYSDALKRAAAHWGIARELYGDGNVYDEPTTYNELPDNDNTVYQPLADGRPLDQGTWEKLSQALVSLVEDYTLPFHATYALWNALENYGDVLCRTDARRASLAETVKERNFERLWKARFTVSDVARVILDDPPPPPPSKKRGTK
jgi:hypothetical protein